MGFFSMLLILGAMILVVVSMGGTILQTLGIDTSKFNIPEEYISVAMMLAIILVAIGFIINLFTYLF